MTDEEYISYLKALARIHIRQWRISKELADDARRSLESLTTTMRLLKASKPLPVS